MTENLQRKQETQLSQTFDQIHQTIIKFNTQLNQRIENTNDSQRKSTQIAEFRSKRSGTETNDTKNATITEPPLPF